MMRLRIRTDVPTSNPYKQQFFIKATTTGGIFVRKTFEITICGAEIVSLNQVDLEYLYMKNSGTGAFSERTPLFLDSLFSNDN